MKQRAACLGIALTLATLCLGVACAPKPAGTELKPLTTTRTSAGEATWTELESIPTSKAQVTSVARSPAQIPALDADRVPVFVSADMGGDDVVALLYLLSHPDVQVLGIGSSEGKLY